MNWKGRIQMQEKNVIVIDDAGIYREITEEEYNEAIGKITVPSE